MPAEATTTVLFTDLVGSTALLSRLGEAAGSAALEDHLDLLRGVMRRHGGQEIKSLGDGLMVTFPGAVPAVTCAVEMQEAVAEGGSALGLRVGLNAGEPDRDREDLYGMSVVVAKRLCDYAGPGQILASDLIRGLVGDRRTEVFRPLGALRLKGVADPVPAYAIERVRRASQESVVRPPLPRPLASLRGRGPLVGRAEPLARLRVGLGAVRRGEGRLVAVGGEPGVGKTRLVAEFAAEAHDTGSVVLLGRSEEQPLEAYQPFVEALTSCLAGLPPGAGASSGLAALLSGHGTEGAQGADNAGARRQALFDMTRTFLAELGRAEGVVLVLDDLQWANAASLLLLRYLVRFADEPLLVVATYNEGELTPVHPLAETFADLRRERLIDRFTLSGLDEDGVAELLRATTGEALPADVVRHLHAQTNGNPLFVEEVARNLAEMRMAAGRNGGGMRSLTVAGIAIPDGVREAIDRRLRRLSPDGRRVLSAAAVLGPRWTFDLLVVVVGLDEERTLDAVEEALAAGLVLELEDLERPSYAFTNALVRDALYADLSRARTQMLHLRAADALEARGDRRSEVPAAAISTHYRRAGTVSDRALEWSVRAAEELTAGLGWEEAIGHLESAAGLMERLDVPSAQRARLLERLADLKYAVGLDLDGALQALERALACHEATGDRQGAARVHSRLGRSLATYIGRQDITRAREHLAAAGEVIDEDEGSPAAAGLNLGVATAALWALDIPTATRASARAMAVAERLQRDALWSNAACLHGCALWTAGELTSAFALIEEAWQNGDRSNHPWVAFLATWSGGGAASWVADPLEMERWLRRELERPRNANAGGQRDHLYEWLAQAHVRTGRLDEARASVDAGSNSWLPLARAQIAFRADGPAGVMSSLRAMRDEGRARGSRWTEMALNLELGRAEAVAGLPAGVDALDAAVTAASEGGARCFEVAARAERALWGAELGRAAEAREDVERCRAAMDADPHWRCLGALIDVVDGILAAQEDRRAAAAAWFARALPPLRENGLVWDEAEVLYRWGAMASREPERQAQHLDAAEELLRRHGAGPFWLERVNAVREAVAAP